MKEIVGKFNTAVSYASSLDEMAEEQIRRICDCPFAAGSAIRIMPDAHAGAGCVIGTTMTVTDKVVPNLVGVDIGCGMYLVPLGRQEIDMARLDAACHFVPSGMNVWKAPQSPFDFSRLCCAGELKNVPWLRNSLGTLGGGNHFVEVDADADGNRYLVIHTGSRNLGKQVAEFYQAEAVREHGGGEPRKAEQRLLAERLKKEGRAREIETAIQALKMERREPDMPNDLCWLSGKGLEDYLHDIEICQEFARRNREMIASAILEQTGLKAADGAFHTIHNYIDTSRMMLRKGAIAAYAGEKLVIPLNMRDGVILGVGRGNPGWNWSAPHGAGRTMSRMQARRQLALDDYRSAMEGIYTSSVDADTIDEAPQAYKPAQEILDAIAESVDVLCVMRPVFNFKAPEGKPLRGRASGK